MLTSQKCPACGATLTRDAAGGRCLRCLLKLALALDEPASDASGTPPHFEQPGDRVGHYKLLQQIGEGGYGVVYMAEQDEPVRRRVALKVIKLGMDTKQVIARFEAERQALAMMDHQNIARVFEAGATDTGRPYFVMELVRGQKITDYCDGQKFSTRQRLELFIRVCQAIQHAHQKGIIHRDIKPSNLLVTEQDGAAVPKIIDFGVAKAMHGRLTDHTLFTEYEQFIGTPAYTSPEQAGLGGLDIDTRSDIYSLGVLLYELLTGQSPFAVAELQRSAIHEILRVIRETEPPRPSARMTTLTELELTTAAQRRQIEPARLPHLLRGDLDWIVMKTLEKDRRRRYETANGLATDLQRHLNNEPVVARPPSASYRFQKMVRRHRLAFAAFTAVVAALAVGLGVSSWEYLREKRARERAVAAEREEKNLRERSEQARDEAEIARANEASLRRKVEARAKILQARALYDNDLYDEAEELLNEIDAADYEPDSAHASLRRGLVWQYIVRGEWHGAMANIAVLRQVDGQDTGREIAQDCYLYANGLVNIGDQSGYENFRQELIGHSTSVADPEYAKFICEVTLLMPADKKLLVSIGRLYDLAADRLQYPEEGSQESEVLRRFSLALVDYRRGNYAQAAARCGTCLSQPLLNSSRIPTVLAISAMSHYQLDQMDEARLELEFARRIIDPVFQTGPSAYNQNRMGFWMEWIESRSLLREAATLIGDSSTNVSSVLAEARARLDKAEPFGKDGKSADAPKSEYDETEKMINEVPALAIQVDGKRAGELYAALGGWRLHRHDWRETAAKWSVVVYGPEERGSLLVGQDLSRFYLSFAPLLVELNDVAGYEKFRAKAIATFGATGLPVNAERTVATCLLLPADTNQMVSLEKMAGVIASAKPPSPAWVPWGNSALALFEYRRGHHARTLELIRKNLDSANQSPALDARSHVLTALAHYRLNQPEVAQGELALCRETIEGKFKAEPGAGQASSGNWYDWWFNEILLREAISLIEGPSSRVK